MAAKNAAKNATAKREPAPTGTNVATLPEEVLSLLSQSESLAKEISGERTMVKFTEIGQFLIGRIHSVREAVNFEDLIFEIDAPNGDALVTLGSTDLSRKIGGAQVGHVLGIFYVADEEVGQPSPMKRFRVFDYGDDFPNLTGVAMNAPGAVDSDDLPF